MAAVAGHDSGASDIAKTVIVLARNDTKLLERKARRLWHEERAPHALRSLHPNLRLLLTHPLQLRK